MKNIQLKANLAAIHANLSPETSGTVRLRLDVEGNNKVSAFFDLNFSKSEDGKTLVKCACIGDKDA
jgi:hypothetical protein